jgi:hypothetical protein
MGVSVLPYETDAPLVVNSYAELPFAISRQLLQSVGRRNSQVFQGFGVIDHSQFSERYLLYVLRQPVRSLSAIHPFRLFVFE